MVRLIAVIGLASMALLAVPAMATSPPIRATQLDIDGTPSGAASVAAPADFSPIIGTLTNTSARATYIDPG